METARFLVMKGHILVKTILHFNIEPANKGQVGSTAIVVSLIIIYPSLYLQYCNDPEQFGKDKTRHDPH